MKHYCCGFLFSEDRSEVLLIKKNRPEYLAGKFNGLGGKLEGDETYLDAMIREFFEECGLYFTNWVDTGNVSDGVEFYIQFYYGIGDISEAITTTDEEVVRIKIEDLPDTPLGNNAIDVLQYIIYNVFNLQ